MDTIIVDVDKKENTVEAKNGRDRAMDAIVSSRRRSEPTEENTQEVEQPIIQDKQEVIEDNFEILKVDGKEIKTTRDKVLDAGRRSLQKESSADRRLAEAVAKEAELEKRRAELDELEKQLLEKSKTPAEDPDEEGRKFAEVLFTDEEAVAKHISRLHNDIKTLKEKQDKVDGDVKNVTGDVRRVKEKEASRLQTDKELAMQHFHSKYIDIASDDEKLSLFNQRFVKEYEQNPGKPVADLVDNAANKYYDKFGGRPEPEISKVSVKENLMKHPKTGSARQKPPPEDKPKTKADVLDDMRRSRGLKA